MENNMKGFNNFVEQLEELIDLPDTLFENEETIAATELMIKGALNEQSMKDQIINEMVSILAEKKFSKKDVDIFLLDLKNNFDDYLKNFTGSEGKKHILQVVFDRTMDFYKESAEHFFNNQTLELAFELVRSHAQAPAFAHDYDACADIYAPEDMIIPPHSFGTIVPTGFKMALPRGWKATISSRSGMAVKTKLRIANAPGQIDAGYLDEVGVIFDNFSDDPYVIHQGDRIAQMAITPVHSFTPNIVEDITTVSSMNRGGGYGSSGN